MTVNPSIMAQLLSLSLCSGIQNQSSDQQSPFSSTDHDATQLFGSLLAMMMNDSYSTSGSGRSIPSERASSASSISSTNSDQMLWQQLADTLPALNITDSSKKSDSGYDMIIQEMSTKYSVPAPLIRSVIDTESGGNPSATSSSGAMGLMQLMPSTAADLGVTNPYDPAQNIEAGTRYLSQLIKRYNGDNRLALAAYNAGSGAVQKYGGIPPFPETQAYVSKVLSKVQQTYV
ncbi:lytic transglycosylase domain-containing protein [Sporolactobacillus terrae]|uniref:Lytic transglycosylase n=1 Tax=Sporolactobacillus terrae TaxID=269673 RepID=A0ABX5Q6A7_9BACL|nr:lytic transglycosylase domain-containing protein [Sporolactobacillus terrae]QAA22175.1 lytic transglycosylase [Sporolactobacillus terrae]QAA25148.1 lytic transglycosylase [Sporolactobacillus terrae]UAK16969.1 lytic transglycosylase domain-containing protein [Sporolactobacillus terrae]